MKRLTIIAIATLISISIATAAAAQANLFGAPGSCDKACLTGIADAYFAALVAHDPSKAAMAPNAKLTENAQVVAVGEGLWKTASEAPTNFKINTRTFYYITSIDLRRVWIADEEKGLVFALSMFRHPMEEKVFTVVAADGTQTQRDMSNQKPFDFESVHIFKIQGGKIHDIEAMGISLPYKSKNGWSE